MLGTVLCWTDAAMIGKIRNIYTDTVEARSVLCYWAARELCISALALSKRLGISQPTASQSVKRGEKIVKEKELKLMG